MAAEIQMVPYVPRHNRAPGSGSVSINPSGTYKAQVTIPSRAGGVAVRQTKSFQTKRAAEEWIRERQKEIEGWMTAESCAIRFGEFFAQWLQLKRLVLSPRTLDDYQRIGRLYLLPRFAGDSLRLIRTTQVNEFYLALESAGVGLPTISYVHSVLRSVLSDAQKEGILFANPCKHSIRLKVVKKRNTYGLSEEELRDFLLRASLTNQSALLHTAAHTGMRLGELLGLTWRDLDLSRRTLHVHHQIPSRYVKGQRRQHEDTKTRSSHRLLPISEALTQILEDHRSRQNMHKCFMGSRWRDHDLVFPSSIGTALQPAVAQKICRQIFREMGLSNLTFHSLRHTCASLLIRCGMSLYETSRYLGHASATTTANIYAHLLPGGLEKAVTIFENLFAGFPGDAKTL